MSLKFVNPQTVAKPAAAYSNLAIVPPGRRLLVLAGQVGNRLAAQFPMHDLRIRLVFKNAFDDLPGQLAGYRGFAEDAGIQLQDFHDGSLCWVGRPDHSGLNSRD